MSRIIAIGDIHGCSIALNRLLKEIQPTREDTVIGIGDYVDRGMASSEVLETLIELVGKTRFIPLIGNHELMMYQGIFGGRSEFEFWFQHGGNATLASYGGRMENIPQHHVSFLSHCVRFYETDTHFFVHANYLSDVPLDELPDETIFWQHLRTHTPDPHINGKVAVVGHTPQPDGDVIDLGHIKAIDTYCYGDQWLSALDVVSGTVWQANNLDDFRVRQIEPGFSPSEQEDLTIPQQP